MKSILAIPAPVPAIPGETSQFYLGPSPAIHGRAFTTLRMSTGHSVVVHPSHVREYVG